MTQGDNQEPGPAICRMCKHVIPHVDHPKTMIFYYRCNHPANIKRDWDPVEGKWSGSRLAGCRGINAGGHCEWYERKRELVKQINELWKELGENAE